MEGKNKTPSKSLFDSVHGKFAHSTFTYESPFSISNVSTPPSRFTKIKNPFEPLLTERLHTHFLSPSIFSKVSSPKVEEFKWTIDEISVLKPADIDESSVAHLEKLETDSHIESTVQAKIDSFFSLKEIVPSPFNQEVKKNALLEEKSPQIHRPELKDGSCQTVLSLPPNLPPELEAALKPYYTISEENAQDSDTALLYQKLFEDAIDCDTTTSECTSPSLILSPARMTIFDLKQAKKLQSSCDSKLGDCQLSPIKSSPTMPDFREKKSATRLDFSENMSVDHSVNVVPDTLDGLPADCSIRSEKSSPSPQLTDLSTCTMNWDLEYKHVSLCSNTSIENSLDEMDVSNSNTPRSKIFISQRKKLSESFLKDDEDENVNDSRSGSLLLKTFLQDDVTDGGYQTGGCTLEESSSYSSNLYASTPTKIRY